MITAMDTGVDYLWDQRNQGKLWTHIKHKYGQIAEEEEE